jgi:CheY-like chemotaxis protein
VSVGTIAASVAHENNNPLSYVLACLEFVIREGSPMVPKVEELHRRYPAESDIADVLALLRRLREPFANIRDGVERMGLIARDLKTFARADEHEASPIDVREVLKSAIRMASNETRYRVTVVTELAEVPWVMASEPRMAQVFLNLLVNAAQAFPEDRPPHACVVSLSTHFDPKGLVTVEVRDNASGMEPHVLASIFEPFFTTKAVGVGTGLGLAVCRNIVQSFGGEISATSVPGRGSAFRVTLPACPGTYRRPRKPASNGDSTPPPSRVRVRVIGDDHVLGNAFRLTLSQAYAVRVATSGAEGLALLLNDGPFDFVFCDLMMPNMTGMDVFDELSRVRPELAKQLLFMTGGAFNREVREFIGRVSNTCLQKPFDPVAVIDEALAQGAAPSA